jgi:RNA polymerase-binding transcription factor DksA
MSVPQLDTVAIRQVLELESAELKAKLVELSAAANDEGEWDSNFADSSQVTAEKGEVDALTASLEEALSDVERALSKLNDNAYGVCEECEAPIAPARLEAIPTARYCITCASKRR